MVPPGTLEALGLYLIRTTAMFISSPVLTMGTGFNGYKIALIVALSLVLYSVTGEPLVGLVDPVTFGGMAMREILVGLSIGFVLQLSILAVKVGGKMVGHEMGFAMASQVDPETGVQVPLITRIWENVYLVALISVNGHFWLLKALANSYERAPVGQMELGTGVVSVMSRLFGTMFAAGLTFAAPVMVLLALVSVMVGLLTRAVPYLNIMEISFSLRVGMGLVSIFLFSPMLEPVLNSLFVSLNAALDANLDAIATR
ncbi:MAG: flagellar biosynthetic protein FliR [Planctomycetota bacterium]|jgi:flagellar biosynthetic protein FliR